MKLAQSSFIAGATDAIDFVFRTAHPFVAVNETSILRCVDISFEAAVESDEERTSIRSEHRQRIAFMWLIHAIANSLFNATDM